MFIFLAKKRDDFEGCFKDVEGVYEKKLIEV